MGLALTLLAVVPWRWIPPPTTAFMLRARSELITGAPRYQWVAREQISRYLALCVVASEDQKFPTHHGFDFDSIWKATKEARSHPRGASTVTQQVAKNLYLWPGRSFVRKGLEAYFTVFIEAFWPKRRILEVYLNIAEFGPGVFGASAASEYAFGKKAAGLTLHEAALLAAVLPNPKRMSASKPSDYVLGRATEIEGRARKLGAGYVADL